MRSRLLCTLAGVALLPLALGAQIRVSPTGLSTNAMNPSTVFLTFGGLRGQVPMEGIWCGEVTPARPPARGTTCDPSTIYGRLPLRSDLSRLGADGTFTDIMAIPASVTRRAYFDALRGQRAMFFYVRRFASQTGGPDEYVAVTCRLTGGGAGVPFSLTNVTVAFETATPVQTIAAGTTPPPLSALIRYNGSGQLRGRWEIVLPGEPLPTETDLLTEGTLPPEERGQQRRYTQLARFAVDAPPGGSLVLPGPDPSRLPRDADGSYLVLLRIEATDDKFGDSNAGAVGGTAGVLHNGAVAGFPMPVLRYVVGSSDTPPVTSDDERSLQAIAPSPGAVIGRDSSFAVSWTPTWGVTYYKVEFQGSDGTALLSAVVRRGTTSYVVPPTLAERTTTAGFRWRVLAIDGQGRVIRQSAWRALRFAAG